MTNRYPRRYDDGPRPSAEPCTSRRAAERRRMVADLRYPVSAGRALIGSPPSSTSRPADPARRPLAARRPARPAATTTSPAHLPGRGLRRPGRRSCVGRPGRRRPAPAARPGRAAGGAAGRRRPRRSPRRGVRRRRRPGRRPGLVDAALGRAPAGAGAARRLRRPGRRRACRSAPERAAPPPGDVIVRPGGLPVLDADGAAALAPRPACCSTPGSAPRYRGETEPIDPVAGHIAGRGQPARRGVRRTETAASRPPTRCGSGSPPPGVAPRPAVGAYCGSGVTAAQAVLALHLAGRTDAALYVGSWSNWVADPARPVASGPTPAALTSACGGPARSIRVRRWAHVRRHAGGVGRGAARLRHGRPSARPGPGGADHRARPRAGRAGPARGADGHARAGRRRRADPGAPARTTSTAVRAAPQRPALRRLRAGHLGQPGLPGHARGERAGRRRDGGRRRGGLARRRPGAR